MMRKLSPLLIAVMISLILCGYSDAAERRSLLKPTGTTKGAKQGMKTYYMGRFAIDLPAEFQPEIQSQKIRYAEVSDFKWKERDRAKERESLWTQKLAKIKKLQLPKGRKQIIIEEKHLKGIGNWAKAVEYYGDYRIGDYIYWTVFVDYGESGLWLTLYGLNNQKSLKNFTNILTHYQYGFDNLTKDSFCLNHGRIELPYLEQEEIYARFAGPMEMKLRIEMNETQQVEDVGVLDRLVASLAMNFAPGVDVDKIRTGSRTVAVLPGQEIIIRGTVNDVSELFFAWDSPGREDSGEYPEIRIGLECPDGSLDEKTKIWDAALDSFRPASKS
ncbi:MAG TPA: T6SS immunity protein Tli4 family protein [Smithellaceae bacterium]|nr:T6SS immunity protein Tli4 family protein [Smithellaceae bacterium]